MPNFNVGTVVVITSPVFSSRGEIHDIDPDYPDDYLGMVAVVEVEADEAGDVLVRLANGLSTYVTQDGLVYLDEPVPVEPLPAPIERCDRHDRYINKHFNRIVENATTTDGDDFDDLVRMIPMSLAVNDPERPDAKEWKPWEK